MHGAFAIPVSTSSQRAADVPLRLNRRSMDARYAYIAIAHRRSANVHLAHAAGDRRDARAGVESTWLKGAACLHGENRTVLLLEPAL